MTANPSEVLKRARSEIIPQRGVGAGARRQSLHYKTILPAFRQRIPVRILNSFNPDHPGTRVSVEGNAAAQGVKAVTSIRGVILVAISGTGMQGIPGIAAKTFDVVAAQQANVLMISQASSENNICFVLSAAEAPRVVAALRGALEFELMRGHIEEIAAEQQVAIVAAVGDRMRGSPYRGDRLRRARGSRHQRDCHLAGDPSATSRSSSPSATPQARSRHPPRLSAGEDVVGTGCRRAAFTACRRRRAAPY
jgi:aspartate kinase